MRSNHPPASNGDLSTPGLKAFFRITEKWGLTDEQERVLLGAPERSTFLIWKQDHAGAVSKATLERISCVLGIYKALHILLPQEEQADGWLNRPNSAPLFDGRTALERMLGGQVSDMQLVRQYLETQLG